MSLRPQMAGGIDGALRLESIIREAEALRRPLQLSDVRLEDFDAVYLPGGHLLRGRRRSAAVPAGTGNDDNRFRDAAGTRLLQTVTCSTTSVPISRHRRRPEISRHPADAACRLSSQYAFSAGEQPSLSAALDPVVFGISTTPGPASSRGGRITH
ncbi:hypothetical protein [Nocardia tengchongensis]|uniref:hypothetical protein n=1 Tax=Nocardia tengchongensis TaxID=2055889 RepID=UPI003678680E